MYSELTYLKNEEKYRNLFEREYCQKEIILSLNSMLDILTMLFLVEVIEEVIRKMYLTQIEHKEYYG